jgi:hypothetical protein
MSASPDHNETPRREFKREFKLILEETERPAHEIAHLGNSTLDSRPKDWERIAGIFPKKRPGDNYV